MGSTLRGLAAGLSLSLAALCAGPLAAQTLDPRTMEWCDGRGQVPDDVQVSACTQIIKSGKVDGPKLIAAYFFRGLTYAQTGRCRLAIPDFTAVIRLDPKDADAYWSRHTCKTELGDAAGAEADRKAAMAIDPRIEEQWSQ